MQFLAGLAVGILGGGALSYLYAQRVIAKYEQGKTLVQTGIKRVEAAKKVL